MQTYLSFFTNKMPFFGKKNSEITTKTKFKTEMQQLNAPCIYCGKEIDYFAKGIEKKAYSVEHIIPELYVQLNKLFFLFLLQNNLFLFRNKYRAR